MHRTVDGPQHTTVKAVLMSHFLRSCAPTLSLYHRKERTFEHTERSEALAQGGPCADHRADNTRPGGSLPTLGAQIPRCR